MLPGSEATLYMNFCTYMGAVHTNARAKTDPQEVAVSAQGPPVVINEEGDQRGFMAIVKPYWTRLRSLFWTGINCCKHRYASFETPSIGACRHKLVRGFARNGPFFYGPDRVQTLFAYLSESHLFLKRSISVVITGMS